MREYVAFMREKWDLGKVRKITQLGQDGYEVSR